MTFWLDLNFRLGIIFFPTLGVTAKKTQLQALTISWLFFAIETFLNFLLSFWAIFLFLGDTSIFLKDIFELHIPVITDDAKALFEKQEFLDEQILFVTKMMLLANRWFETKIDTDEIPLLIETRQ